MAPLGDAVDYAGRTDPIVTSLAPGAHEDGDSYTGLENLSRG